MPRNLTDPKKRHAYNDILLLGQDQQKPTVTFAKVMKETLWVDNPATNKDLCLECLGEDSQRGYVHV